MKLKTLSTVAGILWLSTVLAPSAAVAQDRSPFWLDLEPGPHAVGFRVQYVFDEARAFWPPDSVDQHALGRPIRVFVWYPAEASADTAMTFRGYMEIRPVDARFDYYNRVVRGMEHSTATRQFSPASDSLLNVLAGLRTAARYEATPADGRFPLILHSLGLGDYQLESTVLFEYLASHGYVVATVPQIGAEPGQGLTFSAPSIETQYGDLAFAARILRQERFVDGSRLAVTGHSMGGLVALLMAARHEAIRAVVGLDGSFVTAEGAALLDSLEWSPHAVLAPVLSIHRRRGDGVDQGVLEAMSLADRYGVTLGGTRPPQIVTHFDFQNWPVYSLLVGTEDPRGASARPARVGAAAYLAACRMTLRFLDAALNGRRPDLEHVVADEAEGLVPLESKSWSAVGKERR